MKLALLGWAFNVLLVLAGYQYLRPVETGYSVEQRQSMNALIQDKSDLMDHISVADISLDAELFMETVEYLPEVAE